MGSGTKTSIALCCNSDEEAFQPMDKLTLQVTASKQRKFQPQWYKEFPRQSVCVTNKNVFCLYCWYSSNCGLLSLAKVGKLLLLNLVSKTGKKTLK